MLELHEASGIEQLGSVKWQLTLCLVAVYLICYFSLWKGISTSGKASLQLSITRPPGNGCESRIAFELVRLGFRVSDKVRVSVRDRVDVKVSDGVRVGTFYFLSH